MSGNEQSKCHCGHVARMHLQEVGLCMGKKCFCLISHCGFQQERTVCVRLDGLADKIAEELERTMFASDRKIPEVIVDLLQSLAVQ